VTALTAVSLFLIRFTGQQTRKTDWTLRALVDGLDLYGFVLFAPACVMLLLALQWGGVLHAWDSATIIGLLVGSAVLAVVFILWERRAGENAMIPPALISRRIIAASCATSFMQGGGLILLSYYLRTLHAANQCPSCLLTDMHSALVPSS
jgi:Fungal trichothecene efflux pump (TRI12)